jgi:hypothetical protein
LPFVDKKCPKNATFLPGVILHLSQNLGAKINHFSIKYPSSSKILKFTKPKKQTVFF